MLWRRVIYAVFFLSEGGRRQFFVRMWCLSLNVCGPHVVVKTYK